MTIQYKLAGLFVALALSTLGVNGQAIDGERYEAALRSSELADQLKNENKLEEALAEYNKAEALNPAGFSLNENRGFVNGQLGHWSSAIADFDKFFKSPQEYKQTEKVLNFLLEHKKADVALRLSKLLDENEPTPQSLLQKSKIWQANGRLIRAREAAYKARYLSEMYGDEKNQQQIDEYILKLGLESLGSATPNRSKEHEFWRVVNLLSERNTPPEASELPHLISQPNQVAGHSTIGHQKIVLSVQTRSPDAVVRSISIGGAQDKYVTMAVIQPNIFVCCLTADDIKQHFKGVLRSEDLNGLGCSADQLPDKFLTVSGDKCKVVFQFRGPGIYPLKLVQFHWVKNGKTQLCSTIPPPHVFSAAEIDQLIKKGKFVLARQALTNELVGLTEKDKYETGARDEYERIKVALEDLYKAWHKPEIAKYIQSVSFIELCRSCTMVVSGIWLDLPEFSPFVYEKWKVMVNPQGGFTVMPPTFSNFKSPADNNLSRYLSKIVHADPSCAWQPSTISRPSANLADDGVFGKPAGTRDQYP